MKNSKNEHVYLCPKCAVDTVHHITNQKHSLYSVVCSCCNTTSLVKPEVLTYHHLKWEDELRRILESLENPFDE